ncbi:type II secretion system protein [Janthinobacterium agaricidamnosum]|uniref:Prepilin-type N-terminal cleavage/methylation domain protein n=1 Tax=Janthinobacterium agaricidamnosum NBRC 102515 = DSM 9628 TaxID=1349767 RepID=W0V330_9BURK|nr:prepilin-type N-terminal cleavage/methylation domain-containing protein [Janthinobacterium agaricidamnosum]CDG81980.1 prepilin-type N-terminal cleavage/methylation domain protein [Janthinobacterium agaricidamnosum NBRC 102515 = DSM 9628]
MVDGAARRGFTLIELLVVMALIGMLLSLSVPRYFGNVDKARESVLRQDLALMRDAIDKYFGDVGLYPESLDEIVARRYLRKIPVDPITQRADSWIVVAPEKKETGNVFDIKSGAPGRARDGSEYADW